MTPHCACSGEHLPALVRQSARQVVWRGRDSRFGQPLAQDAVARSLLCGNRLSGSGLHTLLETVPISIWRETTGYVRC